MILAEAAISPEVIFVLLALIASGVKAFWDRKNAQSQEEDDDLYDQHREDIIRQQSSHPEAETWPPESRRQAEEEPAPPSSPKIEKPAAPPPIPQNNLQKVKKPQLSAVEKKALANFEKNKSVSGTQTKPSRPLSGSLRETLADPRATKQAIVLNEILGRPKGLE